MQEEGKIFVILGVLSLFFMFAFDAIATAPEGGAIYKGTATTATPGTANQDVAQGGYILEMNLSVDTQTHFWQGYYGNIFGNITLEDSSGKLFYRWGWNNTDGGEIYAAENSSIRWDTVVAGNTNNIRYVGTWYANTSDSAADTFKTVSNWTVVNRTVLNVPSTRTFNSTGQGNFEMGILSDGGNQFIVSTLYNNRNPFNANNANETLISNQVDYQIMVPVNETTSVTYYFWVELS